MASITGDQSTSEAAVVSPAANKAQGKINKNNVNTIFLLFSFNFMLFVLWHLGCMGWAKQGLWPML